MRILFKNDLTLHYDEETVELCEKCAQIFPHNLSTPHNVHHTLADLACTVMLIETTLTHNAYMPKSTPDCWCCQKWHKCTFLSVLGEPGLLLKFATDIAAGHKSWPRALQKWWNRSKCRLGANSCGPKKPCIRWRHGVQFCVDMSSNYPSRVVFKILYDS